MRGNPYYWIGFKRVRSNPDRGTDLRAIYEGRISITPLHLNLTEYRVLEKLRAAFSDAKLRRQFANKDS
jgi:5'-nucleotidase